MQSTVVPATGDRLVPTADTRAGKYLVFALDREEFAIQVTKVREIMGIQDITAELFEGAEQVASAASQVSGSSQALAQGSSERAASLQVDELAGKQEVVIKSLGEVRNIAGIAGGAILGDGRVGLILDMGGVFRGVGHD